MKQNSYSANSDPMVSLPRPSHPSVPISVYREIIEQLQATQAKLSAMEANNQQLQQEVASLMRSAYRVQQLTQNEVRVASVSQTARKKISYQNPSHLPLQAKHQDSTKTPAAKIKPIWQAKSWDSSPKPKIVAVKYATQHGSGQKKNAQEMNGWFLAIAILVIILTAFTSGFLLVRPLLNNSK